MRNPAGIPALHDDDVTRPNEAYFVYLDWILKQRNNTDFMFAAPAWGQLIVNGSAGRRRCFCKTIREDNAYDYGRWIGNRYKNGKISSGVWAATVITFHRSVDASQCLASKWPRVGKGLTGRDLKYNEPDPIAGDLLITYHTCHEMEAGLCSIFPTGRMRKLGSALLCCQSGL